MVTDTASLMENDTIVIRTHGVPPQELQNMKKQNLNVVNATCKKVVNIQAQIKKAVSSGYMAAIVGDKGHPEVIGLHGYSMGNGIIITDDDVLNRLIIKKRELYPPDEKTIEKRIMNLFKGANKIPVEDFIEFLGVSKKYIFNTIHVWREKYKIQIIENSVVSNSD